MLRAGLVVRGVSVETGRPKAPLVERIEAFVQAVAL
jgi:hypothetical protein